MQLPLWWLVVSGIAFISSVFLNVVLIIGGVVIWSKLGPLLTEAKDQVKRVGDKAAEVTASAKNTVDIVQQRTGNILGTAEEASAGITQKIGAASTALTVLFVAMKVASFARSQSRKKS